MIRLKNVLFVTLFLSFFFHCQAQRNFDDYNLLGLQGGVSLFDISTSDFVTEQQTGFTAGFTTRGSFRGNFDLIYGLSFYSNQVGVFGGPLTASPLDKQFIEYNLSGVQVNFLGSYNIVKRHFSLEFGPILNVNGKLKVANEQFENYLLEGYTTLRAQDIEDISPINFHIMGGATVGIENFRLSAQYQYGVTNMFAKLDDKNLEGGNFDGHASMIVLLGVVYF